MQLKISSKAFSANGGAGSISYTVINPTASPISGSVVGHTDQSWITDVSGGGDYTVDPGKKFSGSVKFRVARNGGVPSREGAGGIGTGAPQAVT